MRSSYGVKYPGNGELTGHFYGLVEMAWGALAAIKNQLPASVFVVNDTQLTIATYMVDMHLAIEMQDNAEIQRKHSAAHRGSDHGSDGGDNGHDDGVPHRKGRRDDDARHRVSEETTRTWFL